VRWPAKPCISRPLASALQISGALQLCWGSSSDGDGSDPRFGAENLTDSWCYSTDRNAAQACGYTREQCLDISQARRGGLCTRTR